MFLEESDIVEPPQGGGPDITPSPLRDMGKIDQVVELLRNLPAGPIWKALGRRNVWRQWTERSENIILRILADGEKGKL